MSRIDAVGLTGAQAPGAANDLRGLDLDRFLELMIAELQNQDPLNPMDNTQILQQIGQMRQISATDQLSETLQAVLTGQNLTTAGSLIGKVVRALTDDGREVQGAVDRASIEVDPNDDSQRRLRIHVGDDAVDLANVREIVAPRQMENQQ